MRWSASRREMRSRAETSNAAPRSGSRPSRRLDRPANMGRDTNSASALTCWAWANAACRSHAATASTRSNSSNSPTPTEVSNAATRDDGGTSPKIGHPTRESPPGHGRRSPSGPAASSSHGPASGSGHGPASSAGHRSGSTGGSSPPARSIAVGQAGDPFQPTRSRATSSPQVNPASAASRPAPGRPTTPPSGSEAGTGTGPGISPPPRGSNIHSIIVHSSASPR